VLKYVENDTLWVFYCHRTPLQESFNTTLYGAALWEVNIEKTTLYQMLSKLELHEYMELSTPYQYMVMCDWVCFQSQLEELVSVFQMYI